MKKLILIQLISFATVILHAQNVNFNWAKQLGGTGSGSGSAVVVDAAGNVYTTGSFTGTIDFDPGPGTYNIAASGWALYISKLDSAGNFVWAKMMGGTDNVTDYAEGYSIALDASGNVYTTGYFGGNIDFNPGPATYILSTNNYPVPVVDYWYMDCFVSKLDAAGNFVWAKKMGGNWQTIGNTISLDASGNIYVFGGQYGTADFDPGPGTYELTDWGIFVSKLDVAGNFIWAKTTKATRYPGQSNDGIVEASQMAFDGAGNIYCTGRFWGEADFDPGTSVVALTAINWDIYVWKLNPDGNFLWVKQLGGTDYEAGQSIAVDQIGNVVSSGYFGGTADFDPGPGVYNLVSSTTTNIFISKLDPSGNFVFAKRIGGTGSGNGNSITLDRTGDIYTTGNFNRTVDFDPGPGTFNLNTIDVNGDMFISKLDMNGNFIWAKQMGGGLATYASGNSIVLDYGGNIYTTGAFDGKVEFDPGAAVFQLTSVVQDDIFVHKMKQCLNSPPVSMTVADCKNYSLNGQAYTESGVYTQTLTNKGGCDSIITLNLTITRTISTVNTAACESYFWNGNTYTVSGTYRDTLVASNGCDSIVVLQLTIHKKSFSTINASICPGQNYAGYTTAGTYTDTLVSANGCDSIRTIQLTIKTALSTTVNAIICAGESYSGYTIAGTYIDTLNAVNGCDSVRTLHLLVKPISASSIIQSICQGETYLGYGASGIYIDTLTGFNGCDSLRTLRLTVYPTYNAIIDTSICNGQNFEGHTASGTYIDKFTSMNGCDSVRTIKLTVLPKVNPALGKDTVICAGNSLVLYPGQFNNYLWQDGSTQSRLTINQPGLYSVIVTDYCGTGMDEIIISSGTCNIYVPSAFTPNNDGKNDLFKIPGGNNLIDFHLVVYNRYGQKVFETTDPGKGWAGDVNGQPQNTGAFAWYCEFRKQGISDLIRMNGTVMLIR